MSPAPAPLRRVCAVNLHHAPDPHLPMLNVPQAERLRSLTAAAPMARQHPDPPRTCLLVVHSITSGHAVKPPAQAHPEGAGRPTCGDRRRGRHGRPRRGARVRHPAADRRGARRPARTDQPLLPLDGRPRGGGLRQRHAAPSSTASCPPSGPRGRPRCTWDGSSPARPARPTTTSAASGSTRATSAATGPSCATGSPSRRRPGASDSPT